MSNNCQLYEEQGQVSGDPADWFNNVIIVGPGTQALEQKEREEQAENNNTS